MLDQLREAARAVLAHYESVAGHRTDMDVGVMAGSMDALRAALDAPQAEAAPKAGAAWRPMSTAPKDGTTIIAHFGGLLDGEDVVVRWSDRRVCMLATEAPGAGQMGEGWEDVENGLYLANPDAWCPIAPAPKSGAGEGVARA